MRKKKAIYVLVFPLSSDLLQAYFGYTKVAGVEREPRQTSEISSFVRKSLFPTTEDLEKNVKSGEKIDVEGENRVFELSEVKDWKDVNAGSYGRIIEHSDESLAQLFRDGAKLTDQQQSIVIRCYQVGRLKYQ